MSQEPNMHITILNKNRPCRNFIIEVQFILRKKLGK
jgi:hypothetical protein